VAALVRGDKETGVYGDIIASQLDADRLDYLLRDSLMTGVKYGVYDLERILKMLRLDPAGQRIVMPAKALMPVEKYLQSRYHMYRQVYFHKAVTAAEVMLTSLLKCAAKKALKGGLPGAEDPDSRLARLLLRPRALSSGEFAQLDDAELLSLIKQWAGGEDPVMRDLSQRLLGRRLFKSIDVSHIEDPLDERLERGRDAVAGAGLDPHYYFLRIESSDTPYRPYDPGARGRGHAGPIYIQAPDGAVSDVEHLSPTISAFIHSAYTLTRIVFPEEANGVNLRETMRKIFQ
jgi:HD superfamily phosphohydrolase